MKNDNRITTAFLFLGVLLSLLTGAMRTWLDTMDEKQAPPPIIAPEKLPRCTPSPDAGPGWFSR